MHINNFPVLQPAIFLSVMSWITVLLKLLSHANKLPPSGICQICQHTCCIEIQDLHMYAVRLCEIPKNTVLQKDQICCHT